MCDLLAGGFYHLPSQKLTYPLKIDAWMMKFPFGKAYFRCYISFRDGKIPPVDKNLKASPTKKLKTFRIHQQTARRDFGGFWCSKKLLI